MKRKYGICIVALILCVMVLFSACLHRPTDVTIVEPTPSAEQSTAPTKQAPETEKPSPTISPAVSQAATEVVETSIAPAVTVQPATTVEAQAAKKASATPVTATATTTAMVKPTATGQTATEASVTTAPATVQPTETATTPAATEFSAVPTATVAAQDAKEVQLNTPSGPVKGTQTDGISVYKGIPYAQPPVGELRFAPPQDVQPWKDVLDCTEFGDIAMQMESEEGLSMSEDCLTLNIWTPATQADERLPVYVWIHGGAFAFGSGAQPDYDGTNFAKEGIVLVTINYRLNAMGFYASQETYNAYGTTGNWGLLDQMKALEWIQDNIEAFGGDGQQVTIGGESAGSYCVSGLITSPLAEGLFQNAIMESGSVLGVPGNSYYARGNRERSIDVYNMMDYTFSAQDDAAGLAKLRAADADVFVGLSAVNLDFTQTQAFMMLPVFDGYVMPEDPYKALQDGKFNKVNLLWGYNGNEGSLFVPMETDELAYETLGARMYGYENQQAVLGHFPVDDTNAAGQQARNILGYGMFSAVMKPFGDALSQAGRNVYAYQFNYATDENTENGLGAHHGSEIVYAFGNLGEDADAEQQALSDEMFTRWVNFIKNGDPNEGGTTKSGVTWPKYDAESTQMLVLDKEITAAEMAGKEDMDFMVDIMFGENGTYIQ